MTVWRLVAKEILHRRLSFALAVGSVAVAVGVLVAQFALLRAHDLCTESLLAAKQKDAEGRLAALEDDYRKYMKDLGFNLLVLPKQQDLGEFWERGYATHTMPESYVAKLADSGTTLLRHLLPIVQQKVDWPEQKRRVILIGTRGEVPIGHRQEKEPMLLAVPEGKIVVGHELARDLGLKAGQAIQFMGRPFTIHKVQPERGTAEDATVWVDLKAGQELLGMVGRINAVEALKCYCKGVTLEQVKAEVAGYLDSDAKIVIRENMVTVRARARERAAEEHEQALAAERAGRDGLRRTRESLAAVVVPLVLVGAAVWIGLLALGNVRERKGEIGILRAIGLRSRQVFAVFLTRALLIGLVGAVLGYALGMGAAVAAARMVESLRVEHAEALLSPALVAAALGSAPALAALASWAPATLAARQDPAIILAKE